MNYRKLLCSIAAILLCFVLSVSSCFAAVDTDLFPAPEQLPDDWQQFSPERKELLLNMRDNAFGIGSAEEQNPSKTIYLTFDDGPNKYTEHLLDILDQYEDVYVTFFVTAQSDKYLDMLTREQKSGHSIGIHSYTHDLYQIYSSQELYTEDLMKTQQLIYDYTGTVTNLIRFPGGSVRARAFIHFSSFDDETDFLKRSGFEFYDWTVQSEGDDFSISLTAGYAIDQIQDLEGKDLPIILLFHDTRPKSVECISEVIEWGLENGYVFRGINASTPAYHSPIKKR